MLFWFNQTIYNLYVIIIFIIMKQPKKISITLSPEVIKGLEVGKYNKSNLIDSLLTEHFKNKLIKK